MVECGQETILAAIIVSSIAYIIIAVILLLMYRYIRQTVHQNSVDNCLHLALKEESKLKDIKIKKLQDQKEILMIENLEIASQRNDLAILLNQQK